jgi:hypothetical protein
MAFVLIIASSSNISFKSDSDINNGKGALVIDSNIFLPMEDKISFSSLLQTINAQEQEEHEVEQEEGSKEQQKEEEEEQEEDKIRKEDCGSGENFDSEIDSCIVDKKKEVCNDGRDNNGTVDSEDSGCLPSKEEAQEQHDNIDEQEDKDRRLFSSGEEPSLDIKENNNGRENPPLSIENQDNNNTASEIYHKARNHQNLIDSNLTAATSYNNNNTSFNEFLNNTNASAVEGSLFLKCHPAEAQMVPGAEASITCTVENKTPKPIEIVLECSGLQGTGIECYINREYPIRTTLIKEMSDINFSVLLVSHSSPPVPAGSYPFTISAEVCINSDVC